MDSKALYLIKDRLDKEYAGLTRNDLLWLLAIRQTPSKSRAHFAGAMHQYLENIDRKIDAVKQAIAAAGCDAETQLGFTYLADAGSSGAALYEARINGLRVILKRTNMDDEYTDSSGVIYETLVYKYFFDYMLRNHITPNIPFYYGSMECDKQGAMYNDLFSEFMDGSEFSAFLSKRKKTMLPLPITFWRPVLFQIIYTLTCFEELNIRHNDLHIGNIYFDPNVTGTIKYHTRYDENFVVNLDDSGLIKIFDMDLSSVDCKAAKIRGTEDLYTAFRQELAQRLEYPVSECDNIYIEGMEDLGLSARGKSSFDLFIAICTILHNNSSLGTGFSMLLDTETRQFISRIFSSQDMYDSIDEDSEDYSGFYCRSKKVDLEGKLVSDLLYDPYFNAIRNTGIESNNNYELPYSLLAT